MQFAAGGAERFRQLTDWDADGTPDADVIARALAAADGFIDPILFARGMGTSIAAPWPELVTLAAAEAVYQAKAARGIETLTAADETGHAAREATLKQYGSGERKPPVDPQPKLNSSPRAAWVASDGDSAPFGRDGMRRGGF
jgi:phage gp36-like protein